MKDQQTPPVSGWNLPPELSPPRPEAWAILLALGLALLLRRRKSAPVPLGLNKPNSPQFTSKELTRHFVSALPEITSLLNLEVATCEQIESFELADELSFFWGYLDLGTNRAHLKVPVTYRYHIQIYDSWRLQIKNGLLIVHAPEIRASLPPAFHSDRMTCSASRGWLRTGSKELLEKLRREITPTLSRFASEPERMALAEEACRESVRNFVQKWAESSQPLWARKPFSEILVRFPHETRTPASRKQLS